MDKTRAERIAVFAEIAPSVYEDPNPGGEYRAIGVRGELSSTDQ
jgi:hypothetical protein